jgi:hypothetical protein
MRCRDLSRLLRGTICVCCLLISAPPVHAMVIPPRIAQLAEASEMIVLAKVKSVNGWAIAKNRRATATVIETWKGPKTEIVEYRVSPTFACDISDANRDETVLLFLAKDKKAHWEIVWSGRGRMPLRMVNGKEYLTHFGDVIFPAETVSIRTPEKNEDGFNSAVELKVVRQLVLATGARLRTAEVIRIAKQVAEQKGIDLHRYKEPEAHFEFTREDKSWFVFFNGREAVPGNHFSVSVDDQTGETRLFGGA